MSSALRSLGMCFAVAVFAVAGSGANFARADFKSQLWSNAFARLELAGASPLSAPQTDRFYPGFQGLANGGVGWRWIDVKLTGYFQVLPARGDAPSNEASVIGGAGGGFRLKVPYELLRQTPFFDVDLLYTRTATLNRFAYALALGVHFPLDGARRLRLGPVIRFMQITNPNRPNFDDRDSYMLTAGVSLELGMPAYRRDRSYAAAGSTL